MSNAGIDREFSFSDQEFKFLADLVNKTTGIVLADHKKAMVYSRLTRRLRALRLDSFAAYCNYLQKDAGVSEMGNLVNAITTNLTRFFREEHHFDHLCESVLAPLAAHPPSKKRLRIWSAGCSSGMESYSIAMSVQSVFGNLKGWDLGILATDIDTSMLKTAVSGQYNEDQYENIPAAYRGDVIQMRKEGLICMPDTIKRLISFKELNLMGSWPMSGPFDVIFCRNVVIYFDKTIQAKLFDRMANLLKPDGWLYIGHSENLHKVCTRFQLVGRTIYRKIK